MQFDAFSYPSLNQVISHVAKYRNRSRGRLGMPIVIRIPFGGAIGAAEDHSDSPETYYAHTAGLKVVAPSSALDAYGLLRKAIADPDPVVFLEPKARYWSKEDGELDDGGAPIGARADRSPRIGLHRDRVRRHGRAVARGGGAGRRAGRPGGGHRPAIARAAGPGDARRVGPRAPAARWSSTRRLARSASARRSWRGSWRTASTISRHPILRVTGHDIPYPPATIERVHVPSPERIAAAIDRVVGY